MQWNKVSELLPRREEDDVSVDVLMRDSSDSVVMITGYFDYSAQDFVPYEMGFHSIMVGESRGIQQVKNWFWCYIESPPNTPFTVCGIPVDK